jgi:hypothetical protein
MQRDRAPLQLADEGTVVPIPATGTPDQATVEPSTDGTRLGARILTAPGSPAGRGSSRPPAPAGMPGAHNPDD